ncbi:MAG TPA: molybdopterin molybdotransferase MoeA [Nitrososphaeraceae archaeon]|nr:molybdopterin molybdotransferase MoeA [Nitrososphaeraceae archaeon]
MHKNESNSYLSIRTAFIKLRKNIIAQSISEQVNTKESLGRVLYNNVISSINIPMYDSSHMDGFAVLYEDIRGASNLKPVTLKVINDIKLGNIEIEPLKSRQAARIPTGGYLSKNSDTVIPIEYVQFNVIDRSVKIFSEFPKGSFISPAGKDISKNKLLFKKGHLIRTQDIALLNLIGIKKLNIFKKPKVAIIPTGSELTNNIEEVIHGKILNTNGQIISTLVEASGGIPVDLGITSDNIKKIQNKIKYAISQTDIILTIGGSSVGHKDLLAESINSMGEPGIIAEGIKLDRGRVTKIAVLKSKPIIILPGPIQGAVNAFIVLAIPLIRSLIGLSYNNKAIINAQITDNWNARKKFQNFVKILYVHLSLSKTNNSIKAEPITGETSNMTVMTRANGYVIVPEKITNIQKGSDIQVNLLSGFSFASGNPIDFV